MKAWFNCKNQNMVFRITRNRFRKSKLWKTFSNVYKRQFGVAKRASIRTGVNAWGGNSCRQHDSSTCFRLLVVLVIVPVHDYVKPFLW